MSKQDFSTFTPTKEGLCIINKDGIGFNTKIFLDGKEINQHTTKATIIIEVDEPIKAILEVISTFEKDCLSFEKIKPENISIIIKEDKNCCKEK